MIATFLRWLRVSERPDPPPGSGPDLRIFRASRRHLAYLHLPWALKQLGALFGILLSLAFLGAIDLPILGWLDEDLAEIGRSFEENVAEVEVPLGPAHTNLRNLLLGVEMLAIGLFLAQLAVSAWWLRLQWRLHWYMVGEEMLRIRSGLWKLREQTFTLAKIQNLTVHQNAVQRLFRIGDLEVHTAGGGAQPESGGEEPLHVGWFRGMDDPWQLRDHIREQLARQKGAGLGDADDEAPEDGVQAEPTPRVEAAGRPAEPGPALALLTAARELRDEARALRASLRS
ncbi:MAG: PH domain-containing protein [Holophagales bacterium]|nr:PH domain-containing protein [Holophagales bacterium]